MNLALWTIVLSICSLQITAQVAPLPPPPPNKDVKAETKKEEDKKDDKEEKEDKNKVKTIAEVTKSCKKIDGLFPIYQDTAKGNIFMEIRADQLNKEYLHFFHSENGSLNAGWVRGNYGWEKIFKISKYYDKLEFKEQNTNFYFDPDNALARTSSVNINEPIFEVETIAAMNEAKDTYLIAADGLYKSEVLAQLKFSFPPGRGPKNPFKLGGMSKEKTKIADVRNYPKNTDVVVDYVYENSNPTNYGLPTVTDARYTTIQIQHSILEMPDNDYQPRYEDPRVGHFVTEVTDQTSTEATPYRDMIHRWHLVKKDPSAELSEPVEPITFWMENTTPVDIRPIIKKGVERWNLAFEEAGFKNAVVVKQQPDDADWDAGDVRYNVLRWTAAPYMGSAWGPSFVNPRTGQILAADIMLDYTFIRGVPTENALYDLDGRTIEEMISDDLEAHEHAHPNFKHFCIAQHEAVNKIAFGKTIAKAQGFDIREVKRMEEETLIELLLHEVGHTLGLAHNYTSSHLWDADQVHDRSLTEEMGLTSSVMDYNPMNLSLDKSKQGNYQSLVPGPYDKWAIEFAYAPSISNERAEDMRVKKLMDRATEDQLRFGNDADAMFSSSLGIDPRINAWDMSSDVMKWGEERIQLSRNALGQLMDRLVDDGESYHEMTGGYRRLLGDQYSALNAISRYIGGVKIDRTLHGQDSESQPFTPVDYSQQKRAVELLNKYAFAPDAFSVGKEIYSHLQNQRRGWNHWGSTEDPKILGRVGLYQRILLSHILNPVILTRMTNSRHYGNQYTVAELFDDTSKGLFASDLNTAVNPARQMLQQNYVSALASGLKSSSYDHIAKAAMYKQLTSIRSAMQKNKGNGETEVHRSYLVYKIDQALDED